MVGRALLSLLHIDHEDTYVDEGIGLTLAAAGVYWQITRGFRVPFPVNIALAPLSLLERILKTAAGA